MIQQYQQYYFSAYTKIVLTSASTIKLLHLKVIIVVVVVLINYSNILPEKLKKLSKKQYIFGVNFYFKSWVPLHESYLTACLKFQRYQKSIDFQTDICILNFLPMQFFPSCYLLFQKKN